MVSAGGFGGTSREPSPAEHAIDAATSGRPEVAQAWALVAIADELKAIRLEMHRQARAAGRRG